MSLTGLTSGGFYGFGCASCVNSRWSLGRYIGGDLIHQNESGLKIWSRVY